MLNAYELQGLGCAVIIFQAQLHDFSDALHEGIEILGLGVAAAQGGDSANVITFFVLLNDNGEFTRALPRQILA